MKEIYTNTELYMKFTIRHNYNLLIIS